VSAAGHRPVLRLQSAWPRSRRGGWNGRGGKHARGGKVMPHLRSLDRYGYTGFGLNYDLARKLYLNAGMGFVWRF
jgi:hypothetical protein